MPDSINKADLIDALIEKQPMTKKEAGEIVDLFFDAMKSALEKGDAVKISGFGNFSVKEKPARQGRNPLTGESIEIAARRTLRFKPSLILKGKLNK